MSAELKQADAEREAQEKKVKELEERRQEDEKRRQGLDAINQSDVSVDQAHRIRKHVMHLRLTR